MLPFPCFQPAMGSDLEVSIGSWPQGLLCSCWDTWDHPIQWKPENALGVGSKSCTISQFKGCEAVTLGCLRVA